MIDAAIRDGLIAAVVAIGLWLVLVERSRSASLQGILVHSVVVGILVFGFAYGLSDTRRHSKKRKHRR